MRSENEIGAAIRSEILALWEARVAENSARYPQNCVHNHRQPLDFDPSGGLEGNPGYNKVDRTHLPIVQEMGICLYGSGDPTKWAGTICDDPVDAARCPLFTPKATDDVLWASFLEDIHNPAWIEGNAPRLSVLLWTLGGTAKPGFTFPWWVVAFFRRFFKVKHLPVQKIPELGEFLPDAV